MMTTFQARSAGADPIRALLDAPGEGVLAIIAGIQGPSYRPMGAMMAVLADGTRLGTLSSGCIEADIALHAAQALSAGTPRLIRYGKGSPYVDIELPCGGGLDILLLPNPDTTALGEIAARQVQRQKCSLFINMDTGEMAAQHTGPTGRNGQNLTVCFYPAIHFVIFGKGPEASTFAALVQSAGYPNLLLSPDVETLEASEAFGCLTHHLTQQNFPKDLQIDDRTAIILFFHDHEWEPPILQGALKTDAFYIGSQGSQRARDVRIATLQSMNVSAANIERLHGPVGLIASARDAGTLAVSVLAEILALAMDVNKERFDKER